jgi:AbrB family looped-hinge helix DNA binding protein
MSDMLTVSAKGQITLPADLRVDFGINAGDKVFAERTEIGYVIKRPKKGLMEYAGFIRVDKIDMEAEEEAIKNGAAARCFGEG